MGGCVSIDKVLFYAIFCLVGLGIGYLIRELRGRLTKNSAEMQAKEILDRSQKEAEDRKRETELIAKDELYKLRVNFEKENQEKRSELQRLEKRFNTKEESIDKKVGIIDAREQSLNTLEQKLLEREKGLDEREKQLGSLENEQRAILSKLSGLSPQQAKEAFILRMRDEAKQEAAMMIRKIEEQALETADKRAREIISLAIQRCAVDQVSESTVTAVSLRDDEMKGRIIGREGRNIRALETATGIDLTIDDTPGTVFLSGFDPVRREVARIALERLIADGRIHTARIEEITEKAREELTDRIREEGEQSALDVNVHGLHQEEIKLLGILKFRTSYGQNALQHSKEIA
ncbi:MAG: Rnase Y domain-containing protein, partial [Candidatus Poribacteria bacterium]